ncbi:unnamed protein product [Cochlearia groenlandica]
MTGDLEFRLNGAESGFEAESGSDRGLLKDFDFSLSGFEDFEKGREARTIGNEGGEACNAILREQVGDGGGGVVDLRQTRINITTMIYQRNTRQNSEVVEIARHYAGKNGSEPDLARIILHAAHDAAALTPLAGRFEQQRITDEEED